MLCRRLNLEQAQASSDALHNVAPDDAFVTDMIKHWWQQPAAALSAAQEPSALASSGHPYSFQQPVAPSESGHPQRQRPLNPCGQGQAQLQQLLDASRKASASPQQAFSDMTAGHPMPEQPLAPFTAGHPQATGIDALTEKLRQDAALGPSLGADSSDVAIEQQTRSSKSKTKRQDTDLHRSNHSVQDVADTAAAVADQHVEPPSLSAELHAAAASAQAASVGEAWAGWQHYAHSSNEGSAAEASRQEEGEEGLTGCLEEIQRHEKKLAQKVRARAPLLHAIVSVVLTQVLTIPCSKYVHSLHLISDDFCTLAAHNQTRVAHHATRTAPVAVAGTGADE